MENWEIAAIFERIAGLLALKGESEFKTRAYAGAARQIIRLGEPLSLLAAENRLREIPGVGPALAEKIVEMLHTGRSRYLARLEAEVPPELLALLAIPGVGFRTARLLVEKLALQDLAGLEAAAREGRIRALPGLGRALEENVARFFRERAAAPPVFHRGVALPLARRLAVAVAEIPPVGRCRIAGQVRRGVEAVTAGLLVASMDGAARGGASAAAAAEALGAALAENPAVTAVERPSAGVGEEEPLPAAILTARTVFGLPVHLYLVAEESFAPLLLWATGSPGHWKKLVARAAARGFQLSPQTLERDGRAVPVRSEAEIYRLLGLPPLPPELREGTDEVARAEAGTLPALLEPGQIRGDLHLHSDWSDGCNTMEEMARKAGELGYAYIAITDHSPSLQIARGLSIERLREQTAAVRRLREKRGGCHIFTGVEVDIRTDGSLDLPDAVLAEAEVVIASVHSGFKQGEAEMTARICRAMAHPLVQVIGHPTGRLIGSRGGYRVNLEELLHRAAATGTHLEINASPQRLDLPPEHTRRAASLGVLLVVNTDAHSTVTMEDMAYGVTAARRGWLSAGQVLNTRGPAEAAALLRRKREARVP